MVILPFISNNICSIAAAVYAERGDLAKAKIFTDALYFFWTFYCFLLAAWIFFAGLRLLKILRHHLNNQHDPEGLTVHKINNGRFKVKINVLKNSIYILFNLFFLYVYIGQDDYEYQCYFTACILLCKMYIRYF